MHKPSDRIFLQPAALMSASQINVYDAINLVAYAKVPLPSVRSGRELIAGIVPLGERQVKGTVFTAAQTDALAEKYKSDIAALRYPVGPDQFAPLFDRMLEEGESALPYFFHEHHELVYARRRAALFLQLHGKLASLVRTGKLVLQLTESQRTTWVVSEAWMSQETLFAYMDDEGVMPWWKNKHNLDTHRRIVRIMFSDGIEPATSESPEPIDPQQLPSYVYALILQRRTELARGSAKSTNPSGVSFDHTKEVSKTQLTPSEPSLDSVNADLTTRERTGLNERRPTENQKASVHPSCELENALAIMNQSTTKTPGSGRAIESQRDSRTGNGEGPVPADDPKMLSKRQVAALLGVTTNTVDNYRRRGGFPESYDYSPTMIRWDRAEILEWKDRNRAKS